MFVSGITEKKLLGQFSQNSMERPLKKSLDFGGNPDHIMLGLGLGLRLGGGHMILRSLCGLRGCKNRPAPFPGRMSYKATKPGLVLFYILACFNCIVAY